MAWFKVDDGLYSHPKWLATPKPARALWVTAGSWSSDQLTDGHVPESVLPMLGGTTREATQLVAAGLWVTDGDGWRFHDWHDRNPAREQVEERRARDAERIKNWRERKAREKDGGNAHVRAV